MTYKIVFSKKFKKEYRRIKNNIAFDKNEFQDILICLSKDVESLQAQIKQLRLAINN